MDAVSRLSQPQGLPQNLLTPQILQIWPNYWVFLDIIGGNMEHYGGLWGRKRAGNFRQEILKKISWIHKHPGGGKQYLPQLLSGGLFLCLADLLNTRDKHLPSPISPLNLLALLLVNLSERALLLVDVPLITLSPLFSLADADIRPNPALSLVERSPGFERLTRRGCKV